MPEYNLRKWYWDMEWQQGGEHHDQITTIFVYDNYDEKYYHWVWFPNQDKISEYINTDFDFPDGYIFDNEKHMIEEFLTTMVIKDPDMLIAWFGHFADLPKLFERACALGIESTSIISPTVKSKGVKAVKDGFEFKYGRKDIVQLNNLLVGELHFL